MKTNNMLSDFDAELRQALPECRNKSATGEYRVVHAVEQIREVSGGTRSHVMRCSDSNYYVVKFQNNPQGGRVLFNDLLGSRLAARLKLPVAATRVVMVDKDLIDDTPAMRMTARNVDRPCQAGPCFGSRFPVDPGRRRVYGEFHPYRIKNRADFLGMLVFDKWTCNTDRRQVVFYQNGTRNECRAVMIDQGFCFNSIEWNFPDAPRRSLYIDHDVYQCVRGVDSFEPWLTDLESRIDANSILAAAQGIPPDWYGNDTDARFRLIERLDRRRKIVRELIWSMAKAQPPQFPNWVQPSESRSYRASA
jgi:hypothetical protein